jgi:hypothetical protein
MVIETQLTFDGKYKQYFLLLYGGSLHNSIALPVAAITVAFANSFESFVYDCVCCYFMSNSLSVSVAVANSSIAIVYWSSVDDRSVK